MMTVQSIPRDVVIASADGTPLRGWYWARPEPRAVLVIAHGFGEHGGCYRHVAEALGPALDFDVLSPDQRGHGRSPGRRGVVRRFEDLIADVQAALDWSARERPGLPQDLLGHSNGGLLALLLALSHRGRPAGRNPGSPAGLILSNPALRIVTPIPAIKLLFGKCLLHLAPWVTLSGKLDSSQMTRDPVSQRDHETDPLRHSRMSAPLYFGMAAGGEFAIANASSIHLPLLTLLGGSDPVIDARTTTQVFERFASTDKSLRVYPPMLHEPLNELGREEVFADVESWLKSRL
jgi:alpha-beta hydrolase superfamily lysophospholipase